MPASVARRTVLIMNLQSRSRRWLAAVNLAKTLTEKTLVLEERKRAAGNPMPLQAHEVFTKAALYELRLTAEADQIPEDVPLSGVLSDVVHALGGLKVGPEFRASGAAPPRRCATPR